MSTASILIPTLNAASTLPGLLEDLRRELPDWSIVIADGGSTDETRSIAESQAELVTSEPGRGQQLQAGVAMITSDWLLVLHADSRLPTGFGRIARNHIEQHSNRAGVAQLRFNTTDWRARLVAWGANWRTKWLGLPYGDQGLLLPMSLYQASGGYPAVPLMEDVLLVRALKHHGGHSAIRLMPTHLTTSAERYRRDGYLKRVLRNLRCLIDLKRGVPIEQIAQRYRGDAAND